MLWIRHTLLHTNTVAKGSSIGALSHNFDDIVLQIFSTLCTFHNKHIYTDFKIKAMINIATTKINNNKQWVYGQGALIKIKLMINIAN